MSHGARRHCQHEPTRELLSINAVAESFFATLEWELLTEGPFASHGMMHRALVEFIDGWYNHERMHSSLGYQTPAAFEQNLRRTTRAA